MLNLLSNYPTSTILYGLYKPLLCRMNARVLTQTYKSSKSARLTLSQYLTPTKYIPLVGMTATNLVVLLRQLAQHATMHRYLSQSKVFVPEQYKPSSYLSLIFCRLLLEMTTLYLPIIKATCSVGVITVKANSDLAIAATCLKWQWLSFL